MNDFAIVTACTPDHMKQLQWSLPTWTIKPQFRDRKLYIFIHGFKDPMNDFEWIQDCYQNVKLVQWDMEEAENQRELMLSSFVLGTAQCVEESHFVKMDADAYFTTKADVFVESDFDFDIVSHPWGYTKPGWWINKLDAWIKNKQWNGDTSDTKSRSDNRIISFCCLHRTEFIRNAAALSPHKLPVPSHDTYVWYLSKALDDVTCKTKNMKAVGVGHNSRWRALRESICASDGAWNPRLNKQLLNNVQLEITTACNLHCPNCDRNCGTAPSNECMTVGQVRNFVNESLALNWKWKRIDIIGGEPTLHRDLPGIINEIGRYKEKYKHCKIRFTSNGNGAKVNATLEQIPAWIQVRNSAKEDSDRHATFDAANMAPIDEGISGKDALACSIPWRCGLALTRYGYFLCGAGASICRVMPDKAKICGLRRLEDLTPQNLQMQRSMLCQYCGHSKSNKHKAGKEQMTSPTWQQAFAEYKQQTPIPLYKEVD